jgi:c-di-GMP-binding flagellar brake protein YcgR
MVKKPMSDPTHPTPANTPGRERRVFVRVPPKSASPVLSVSEQEEIITWKARVRDISVGGVCLLLNGTFKPGTMLDVVFTNPRTQQTRTLLAKVVRNETKDDVHWAVACAFLQKLSEEELDALTE